MLLLGGKVLRELSIPGIFGILVFSREAMPLNWSWDGVTHLAIVGAD